MSQSKVPLTDLRITKGELPVKPVEPKRQRKKLTSSQKGTLCVWALVAVLLTPVIVTMLWLFGPLVCLAVFVVCIARL